MPLAYRTALVLGPAGSALATYLWTAGRYGATGGTILVLAMVVWTYGLIGLLDVVRLHAPRYAAVALPVFLYGAMGGAAFGFQGVFEDIFDQSTDASLAALGEHPFAANLLLWLPGPLMPLSLLVLGVVLARIRLVPLWTAVLLCAGAVAFPLSRIPRIDVIAYLADGLLVAAFAAIARLAADREERHSRR
ncbi:hypothetical protein ACFOOK_01835 [Micromonospora krabiensis]|uniref:Uncharacterized protein n=1 Tax=Micromonospora krabiensis TaxID=307121 RepID=A0A1C3MX24_9ACTN|nr:hypothetical protein [Micromonospora krabiensis]SBV24877.1 hypothetical protein GA0070620_0342 [Micromonospora krabiensis]